MKLKQGFITHNVGKTQMMVATGPASSVFRGLVRSNETAAFIVDCLKKETTEEEIVKAMHERFEAPEGVIEKDVDKAIANLQRIGALE